MEAASGADKGFFQQSPTLDNQFYDETYQRCFRLFLPQDVVSATAAEVAALGQEVISDQVFSWITDAERNKPYLKGSGRDAFGRWTGELVTGEGWRQLQNFGIAKGFVATGYDSLYGPFSRSLQFLRLFLFEPSCANVTCPSAMQDGAARLLQIHLTSPHRASRLSKEQRQVFEDAYHRLISRDPAFAWTSGQWMTERTGGSDVSLTETTAVPASSSSDGSGSHLGPWSLNGFKWFSSATDSDMTVLLARTTKGGLSTFLAPMRRPDPKAVTLAGNPNPQGDSLNGVRIQRLKNKVGTRPLPTAELVIEDMRAWMIGEEGRGIQEISTVLNITRIHSAVAAVGYVSRSLAIAKGFAQVREIGTGKGGRVKLAESPLHMRTLSRIAADHRGHMLLTFLTSHVLGVSEHGTETGPARTSTLAALTPANPSDSPALLRVLTQITKAYVCKNSVSLVFSCMESLGGVGYLDNTEQEHLNLSRLWRDCAVLPIWEGTTDVLSTDFVRAVKHPKVGNGSLDALENFIAKAAAFEGRAQKKIAGWDPLHLWKLTRDRFEQASQADLMSDARDLVWRVSHILIAVLLQVDANRDGDDVAGDILARFVREKFSVGEEEVVPKRNTKEMLQRDSAIVYGASALTASARL